MYDLELSYAHPSDITMHGKNLYKESLGKNEIGLEFNASRPRQNIEEADLMSLNVEGKYTRDWFRSI